VTVRILKHKWPLRPSVEYLRSCKRLMLDTRGMAEFVGVPLPRLRQMVYSDRIPIPINLSIGGCPRWNIFELLDWVEAGCPKRGRWNEMRGGFPLWRGV
jgi:hypothetical protein